MPTTQIELDYGNETLDRVIYFGNMEEHLGVAHETMGKASVRIRRDMETGESTL